MITEKGTITTSTPMDADVQRELTKQSATLSIVYTVLGGVFLVAYIPLFVFAKGTWADPFLTLALFLGILFLFVGLLLIFSRKNLIAQAAKYNRRDEVEFCGNHFVLREYTDGELTALLKVYYGWLVKTKETENYLFLYNTTATAVPVRKTDLTPEELKSVRAMINSRAMPVKEEA